MADKITWANEKRKLSDLIPWPINPAQIGKDEARRLEESLDEFGQIQTIAISPKNEIYDGHQRQLVWGASSKFGKDYEVDVRVSSRELTERERKKLVIYLRKGTVGDFDFDLLANNWELDDLLDWGFDRKELDLDLWAGDPPDDPGAQMDKAEELREKWGVESGQLWRLGEHRLICGDCTDRAVVERVMGGEKADIVFTDPPYGIEYRYTGYKDKREGYYSQMAKAFGILDNCLSENSAIYIKQYTGNLFDFREVMPKRWRYKNLILWRNASQARPRENYNNAFEIIYEFDLSNIDLSVITFLELGKPPFFKMAEKRFVDWDGKEKLDTPEKRGQMWNLWDDIKPLPGGFMRSEESLSDGSYKLHSCQMPVLLPERAMRFSSKEDAILVDIYEGSGTTLIACERLGRKCRAVEISPAYCAVAIQRWVDMVGGVPELIATQT